MNAHEVIKKIPINPFSIPEEWRWVAFDRESSSAYAYKAKPTKGYDYWVPVEYGDYIEVGCFELTDLFDESLYEEVYSLEELRSAFYSSIIDWDNVNSNIKYIAIDQDGTGDAVAFKNMPHLNDGVWDEPKEGRNGMRDLGCHNIPLKTYLFERPEMLVLASDQEEAMKELEELKERIKEIESRFL